MSDTSDNSMPAVPAVPAGPAWRRPSGWPPGLKVGIPALVVILVVGALTWGGGDGGDGQVQRLSAGTPTGAAPPTSACPSMLGLSEELCRAIAAATGEIPGVSGSPTGQAGQAGSENGAAAAGGQPPAGGQPGGSPASGAGQANPATANPANPANAGGSTGSTVPSGGGGPGTTAGGTGGGSTGQPAGSNTTVRSGGTATTAAPAATGDTLPPDVIATVCAFVRAGGLAPLRRGTPEYSAALDPDGNGLACE